MIGLNEDLDQTGDRIKLSGWVLENVVLPNSSIRQGDLIRFQSVSDPLKKMGIVITADCDLERKKHARLLTLVPVISVIDVLENYLMPEYCENKRDIIERYAFAVHGIESDLDYDVKIAMLGEKQYCCSDDPDSVKVIAYNFILNGISFISINSYKKLMSAIGGSPKGVRSFVSQIRTRGDLLVLPEARCLGIESGVAWVRHIWQVPLSDVALRTSEISSRSGERVARLDSPYRYRLTQLMAQVFSDIGLPDVVDTIEQTLTGAYA